MGMDGALHFHLDTLHLAQEISLVLELSISLRTMAPKESGSLNTTEILSVMVILERLVAR